MLRAVCRCSPSANLYFSRAKRACANAQSCCLCSPSVNLYFSRAKRACANDQSCLPLLTVCKHVFFASGASMCKGSELFAIAHRLCTCICRERSEHVQMLRAVLPCSSSANLYFSRAKRVLQMLRAVAFAHLM